MTGAGGGVPGWPAGAEWGVGGLVPSDGNTMIFVEWMYVSPESKTIER